jgi:hypothetical protein
MVSSEAQTPPREWRSLERWAKPEDAEAPGAGGDERPERQRVWAAVILVLFSSNTRGGLLPFPIQEEVRPSTGLREPTHKKSKKFHSVLPSVFYANRGIKT